MTQSLDFHKNLVKKKTKFIQTSKRVKWFRMIESIY